ncbi:MAG: GNAT family N-acetyltransferase [Saprospiraceae bacterium]|nr:GNAT family N-acetyltransferase [Saprospiraceae bacterium]
MTNLTKTFCNKLHARHASMVDDKYSISLHDSIRDIEKNWTILAEGKDIFFCTDFLSCLEDFPASGIKPYYGLIKDSDETVGILYFQSKYVRLRENLRAPENETKSTLSKISAPIKQAMVRLINFQTIVCGNLLLTGKYGFYFKPTISRDEQFYIVIKAAQKLNEHLRHEGTSPGLMLIKDFFSVDIPVSGEYHKGFTKFKVQPKMILELKPEWKTFDDYLSDMKSKYRVRARKALQKASEITRKVFSSDQIAEHRATIHALYKNVSDQADFNAFVLHEHYFENLQIALGKNMVFTTYWKNDKMVAFFTSIKNFDILDAHFLGYDPSENIECQLYLNMLYDLIKEGIDKRVSKVDMSRTAVEIKSTVGAVPHDMYLYLKHANKLLNKTVETILGYVKPNEQYIIRSPFRDDELGNL